MRSRALIAILAVAVGLTAAPTPVPAAAADGPQQLIAPASACPHQTAPGAAAALQLRAMRCLTNFARAGRDLPPLSVAPPLDHAAGRKSADILRCGSFSHEACGREFTHWIERSGYRGCALAENIAWGTGRLGSVRSIFRSWMRSPGHRENILGSYEQIGIGLRIGRLEGNSGAHVWAQNFGAPC